MTRLYIVDQSGLEVGGHYYSYTGCVADAARRLGLDVVVLANNKFRIDRDSAEYPIVPCFTYTWAEAERLAPLEWRPGNIAYEIYRALRRYPAAPTDHVFLHTIGYRELLCLLDWCVTGLLPGDPIPYFHLLLRRDPDILVANYHEYAHYFRFIAASPYLRTKLRFHADTDLLTTAFAGLTELPFAIAPIPFPQDDLRNALAARPDRRAGDPLTAIYLGDARLEKGYQHLPAALSYLWPDYVSKGKIRFILQSNFNTPGGEPGILTAVQNLAGHPATTLLNEALQPAEYYQTLANADLVLIPYSAQSYRYRSSGILIEAMAAGKPVVTTADSWMAAQVTPDNGVLFDTPADLGRAIATAIDRYDQLAAGAQRYAGEILEAATGRNLVRHLLAACPVEPEHVNGNEPRRVLLVMNGDGMVLRNGSSRIAQAQLRYLADAGHVVVGLFLTYRMGQTQEELESWRAALADAIKSFAFERVFIAGPGERTLSAQELGAICDARQAPDWPLQAEFDFTAGFEFGASLLRSLRQHPVDAVLLNYITNFPVLDALGINNTPVICELHDLQSLQRAIYAGRPPEDDDFDTEFSWLSRCAALISLTPRETAIIRERLPDTPIETTGVILPEPPPPLHWLAGVTDLSEIIAMAGPADTEARAETLATLGEVGFADLLFVGSNHLPNVSGLRWFLDNVYEPYLAAHQVSVVVAGSICDIEGWPDLSRVFFIGPVTDLAPLYAAARFAILPIREGAGSPVKSFEAFAYGRPVVGTAHAFRGVESEIPGAVISDDPEEFAQSVLHLLNSATARDDAARQSRQLAKRYNNIARYYRSMNRVFGSILASDDTAPPETPPDDWMPVEWSLPLQAVNRIARSFIEGLPLDGWAISLLAREPADTIDPLIDSVSHRLLHTRDAAILTMPNPAATNPPPSERAAADLAFVMRLALGRASETEPVRSVVSAELPLDIGCGKPMPLALDNHPLKFSRLTGLDIAAGSVAFHAQAAKPDSQRTGLRVIELTATGPDMTNGALVVRQALPIEPGRQLFGRDAFGGTFFLHGDGTAELPPEATGSLRLPRMACASGLGFVDLLLVSPSAGPARPFALTLNGAATEPQVFQTGSLALLRLFIDGDTPAGDFGELRVELTNRHPHAALRLAAAYSGLLIGPAAEAAQIATLLATSEPRALTIRSPRLSEVAQSVIPPIVRGQPLTSDAVSLLAAVSAGDTGLLAPLIEPVLRRQGNGGREAKAVLDDIGAIVAAYYGGAHAGDGIIVSPILPVTSVDRDGREQPDPARTEAWAMPIPSGTGSLRIKLDAALDIPSHPGVIGCSGFHPAENAASPFRWTGPETVSKIVLPVALTVPARLVLQLGRTGQNTEAEHFVVFCNGKPVPHDFAVTNNGALLGALLPASAAPAPWTEIAFSIAHRFTPPLPDLRRLGVVFRSLSLTLPEPQQAVTALNLARGLAAAD